jgi:hypothetical protein
VKKNKRIDLGEYIIEIKYDSETSDLTVTVLDELQDVIDMIHVSDDEDSEDDLDEDYESGIKPELN